MKLIIGGNVVNTKKILFVTPVETTSNSAHDVYKAFTIVFLNNKPLEINIFSRINNSRYLSEKDLEDMRAELIAWWCEDDKCELHEIKPAK